MTVFSVTLSANSMNHTKLYSLPYQERKEHTHVYHQEFLEPLIPRIFTQNCIDKIKFMILQILKSCLLLSLSFQEMQA